jgi:chromosome segregation ATPase
VTEARVKQKHAEDRLTTKTRELEAEREEHTRTRRRLEGDARELETERHDFVAACRELEAEVAEQREARTAAEEELKRAEERSAALQHQLQVVWAQLQQQQPEAAQPWWRRFGS